MVERPRAADDFDVIRERLEQLRHERAASASADTAGTGDADAAAAAAEAERRRLERCEGAPPSWVPTIFLPQPTD